MIFSGMSSIPPEELCASLRKRAGCASVLPLSGAAEGDECGTEWDVGASLWVEFKALVGKWFCSETPMLSVAIVVLSCASASV